MHKLVSKIKRKKKKPQTFFEAKLTLKKNN